MAISYMVRTSGQVANYGCQGFAYVLGACATAQLVRGIFQPDDREESIGHFLQRHYVTLVNLAALPAAVGIYKLGGHLLNKAHHYADILDIRRMQKYPHM
jgi:hypothetical protein